ncbi:MAG: TSUP family transporter, partial [Paracoccaceae bacterium]|nr:TSUP family transporter [Paracoccaceae bacterium]
MTYDFLMLTELAAMLFAAGAATGLLAGMFGVGGGAISVPILFFTFGELGSPPEIAMPLAVGTSLAIIVPTSI